MGIWRKVWIFSRKITGFIVVSVLLAGNAFAGFDTVVAFGDSLTDHGGLKYYFPYDPDVRSVYSNGDTWVEYFAEELGADLDNNAIAGAMTEGHINDDIQAASDAEQLPDLGFTGQIEIYLDSNPVFVPSSTLFAIWIGGNDILDFMAETNFNDSSANINSAVITMITAAMSRIQGSVSDLHSEGARYFLIMNLPDLGATPKFINMTDDMQAAASAVTTNYNTALASLLGNLRSMYPDSTFYGFDVFNYMNDLIDADVFPNVTGTYMVMNGSEYTGLTNEPASNYLFWDWIHPMTKAHQYLGEDVADYVLVKKEEEEESTCFISTVSKQNMKTADVMILAALALISILASAGLRRKTQK